MNEILVTWQALLPDYFFHRMIVFIIGLGMFIHFLCMATAAPEGSPRTVGVFLMFIAGSAISMALTALFGELGTLFKTIVFAVGSMFAFWLWLWFKGLHVKEFLADKYGQLG